MVSVKHSKSLNVWTGFDEWAEPKYTGNFTGKDYPADRWYVSGYFIIKFTSGVM